MNIVGAILDDHTRYQVAVPAVGNCGDTKRVSFGGETRFNAFHWVG